MTAVCSSFKMADSTFLTKRNPFAYVCVFPTQGRVISSTMVQSDGGVGDWYISIERTKAFLGRPSNCDGNVWIHGGFEGNHCTSCGKGRWIMQQQKGSKSKTFNSRFV